MLFPVVCAGCGRAGSSPCHTCIDNFAVLDKVPAAGTDLCLALLDYDPLSLRFIAQLKYRGMRSSVSWFALAMAQRVSATGERFDALAWVPAAGRNRRRRGFDQCETLARPLGRRLGVPVGRFLRRLDNTGQTGRPRRERLRGPALVATRDCSAMSILVLDDVMTTGASMSRAAAALREAGAARVVGIVAAHRRFHYQEPSTDSAN